MNWYFWRMWLPMTVLTGLLLHGAWVGTIYIHWCLMAVMFFLLGPVGVGVGYHRLFSHRSFKTWKTVEYALALLGTLSGYAPVLFWTVIHQHHHAVADSSKDHSSPDQHGFFEAFFLYRMRQSVLDTYFEKTEGCWRVRREFIKYPCVRAILRDPVLMFLTEHSVWLFWVTTIGLLIVSPDITLSALLLPAFIERQRVNITSSLSHMRLPTSYRSFLTNDTSYNDFLLGYLTFGFGWHNNHHRYPGHASCHIRWWELDIEGLVAKALTRRTNP